MAFRSDVSIDWTNSPRIITVAAPSTELTMQELYDTVVTHEAYLINGGYKDIIIGSGKQELDDTTLVGITLEMYDALVSFEARDGTEYGGVDEWTLCNLRGGNLVAYNTGGVRVNPRQPTAFVSTDRTSSASATLQQQDALQYASYGDVVSVNLSSPYDGTDYPSGNKEYNVNNIQDAVTICNNKGFDVLRIKGLVPLVLGDDVSYKTIRGNNPLTAILSVGTEASTQGVICENLTFSGVLDGDAILEHCVLGEVQYFNGYINDCALTTNTIFVNGIGLFMACKAGATCSAPPTIDLLNATGLGIREFIGDLIIKNKVGVGTCKVAIDGELTIDATCTAGSITVYGDGYVTNNGTGTFELIDRTTGTPQEIAQATLDAGVATSQQVQNAAML